MSLFNSQGMIFLREIKVAISQLFLVKLKVLKKINAVSFFRETQKFFFRQIKVAIARFYFVAFPRVFLVKTKWRFQDLFNVVISRGFFLFFLADYLGQLNELT